MPFFILAGFTKKNNLIVIIYEVVLVIITLNLIQSARTVKNARIYILEEMKGGEEREREKRVFFYSLGLLADVRAHTAHLSLSTAPFAYIISPH